MTTTSAVTFVPTTSGLLSVDGGSAVTFDLYNNSTKTLNLYWLDRSGTAQLYNTLAPGAEAIQPTYSAHAWEVKSTDGSIAFEFHPSVPGAITVGANNQPTFTDFSEKIIQTSNGTWSTSTGYGLINVAKSLGVPDLGTNLPVGGQNNNVALDVISASSAWAAGYTGKGVKVAVIDVGIYATNPEISSNVVGGYDFAQNDADPSPDTGAYKDHPLGVASIIAGSHSTHTGADTMGVAPDAQLLNVRVGTSTAGSSNAAIADGIHWAVDNGAKVICMPLESTDGSADPQVVAAVDYAYQHNVVTVIIGGNYSNYGPTGPAVAASIANEAIDVGNYNALAGTLYGSSNMAGITPFNWVVANSSGYTPTTDGSYAYHDDGGTSFAGPYVAGLAALLFQQNPNASATEIMNKIISGASVTVSNGTPVTAPTSGITPADLSNAVNNAIAATKAADAITASAAATAAKTAADAALSAAVHDALATAGQSQPTVQVASSHDFLFTNSAKSDLFVGVDGLNTASYSTAHTGFTVASVGDHFTVTDKASGVVDTLYNVERVQFGDSSVALDIGATGNAGEVARLYQAAFARTPDAGGLGYFLSMLDNGTASLSDISHQLVTSTEFVKLVGAAPTSQQFVSEMYSNVLHRAPDAAGFTYWTGMLDNHQMDQAGVLASFAASSENVTAVAAVIGQGVAYTPYESAGL